ncbi:MAG: peptidase C11 [Acetatifactor sp.]|nr:peptidase C11 [Acetatifactor sp.]
MNDRPVSRKKNVTGSGSVQKRGSGLGSGPVGGGAMHTGSGSSGGRVTRGGGSPLIKLAIVVIVLLLGGGGGLGALLGGNTGLGGSSDLNNPAPSVQNTQSSNSSLSQVAGLASSFLGAGYTGTSESGNASWSSTKNTGALNTEVAANARDKYTVLKGDGTDKVTIFVYMCGTDLESRSAMATKDMQEMLGADIGDNINLIVYTGGCSGWRNNTISSSTNQIYRISDHNLTLIKDNIGDKAMTDPDTLAEFIKWGADNYPADRNLLIFWDHGGGSVTGYGYDEKHRSEGAMDLSEIDSALTEGGIKYDFVGFDACLMATVETGLMLDAHSDYMVASEETEPGIGWYYTDWLTKLNSNTSMSTLEIGKNIADDFVEHCSIQCMGQKTTLSLVDLAELSANVPEDLKVFANSTTSLIEKKEFKAVSDARSSTREFAGSKIDQIDLYDFAVKLGGEEGRNLAESLKGAVKYNLTSSNMTNAYGLSIYFPYRQTGKVNNMVSTYDAIGMDDSYSECIMKFASMGYYGQAAAGGNTSPASMLQGSSVSSAGGQDAIMELINAALSMGAQSFLGKGIPAEDAAEYIAANRLDISDLNWKVNSDGEYLISLSDEQWKNVHSVDQALYVDDGEGYIDLGLDNAFEWDEEGNLLAMDDRSWLAIEGRIVAYYHIDTTGNSSDYTITGRVPVMLNGERADLILVFDSDHEDGYVAGATFDYRDGETEAVAKNMTELEPGDTLDFLCDYYSYDGTFNDAYYLGEQYVVEKDMSELMISDLVIENGKILQCYSFEDIYGNRLYTDYLVR